MNFKYLIFYILIVLFVATFAQKPTVNFIDPFYGVDNDGHTLPGAAMPFSKVKLSPDMVNEKGWLNTNSGYISGRPVIGFSHTHVSGTGGGAKYGNFRVMPLVGAGAQIPRDFSSPVTSETAKAGYYSALLTKSGIKAELTLTPSVGFHRYTFPENGKSTILVDASSLLDKGSDTQHLLQSGIELISDTEMSGFCTSEGGWNRGAPYTVYFYAKFDTPASEWGTYRDYRLSVGSKSEKSINAADHSTKSAFFTYQTKANQIINIKFAISFTSIDKAKEIYQKEAAEKGFEEAHIAAENAWQNYCNRLEIKSDNAALKSMIYSGLYHAMLMPVNRTGDMPGWDENETYYDDYYAIWDTYRTVFPFLTLVASEKVTETINSLITIGQKEGFMPDARSGNSNGLTQGGSDGDIVVADAFVKGIKGINYSAALNLMLKNATVEPSRRRLEGREGITDFNQLGFVTTATECSGSKQMEYAYCDYAIYQLAKGLKKSDVAEFYLKSSDKWTNLWNPNIENKGAKGFIIPRQKDGSWLPNYDPTQVTGWAGHFYESSSWESSLFVPHNIPQLIKYCGGNDAFVNRLNTFFGNGETKQPILYNVTNEPGFLTPCLYTWAGRYDLTAKTVREIMKRSFKSGRAGLPGNDDSGAMSTWLVFNAIGLFPNAGQDYYLLTSPLVSEATFNFQDGKSFKISVKNQSPENIYIVSAKLNGRKFNQAWIRHADIVTGGKLDLIMGNKPSDFGTKNLPVTENK